MSLLLPFASDTTLLVSYVPRQAVTGPAHFWPMLVDVGHFLQFNVLIM